MEAKAKAKAQEVDRTEVIEFCPGCFSSSDGGSCGEGIVGGNCYNCGAGSDVRIPRWAVESIRTQASWVGRRYYPGPEDKENAQELKYLRALPKAFPGRSAEPDKEEKYRWWVKQELPSTTGSKSVSTMVKASSTEDAIEASRFVLPYVPAEALNGK